MNYLLFLDYFATGEGRLISFYHQKATTIEKMKLEMNRLLDTDYFSPGYDIYNVDELIQNIKDDKTTKEQKLYLDLLKEHTPVFYKHLMVSVEKGGHPIEEMYYNHHINLA